MLPFLKNKIKQFSVEFNKKKMKKKYSIEITRDIFFHQILPSPSFCPRTKDRRRGHDIGKSYSQLIDRFLENCNFLRRFLINLDNVSVRSETYKTVLPIFFVLSETWQVAITSRRIQQAFCIEKRTIAIASWGRVTQ